MITQEIAVQITVMQLRHSRCTLQVMVCQVAAFIQLMDRHKIAASTMHASKANFLLAPGDPYITTQK